MNYQLPSQVFFRPNDNFWKFMKDNLWTHYREHIDVGAGMGLLTEAMIAKGYRCKGIDMNTRVGQSKTVEQQDALEYHADWDNTVILARPNHGDGLNLILRRFVGWTEVLYIGLEKNIETDLDGFGYKIVAKDVGEDNEVLIRVLYRDEEGCYDTWCLIEGHAEEQEWWIMTATRWENEAGGGWPRRGNETIFEQKKYGDPRQMYQRKETMVSKNSKETNGWLAPDGEFLPARSRLHAGFMQLVFGLTEKKAGEVGFIRCYGDDVMPMVGDGKRKRFCTNLGKATLAQIKTMKELGWKDDADMAEFHRMDEDEKKQKVSKMKLKDPTKQPPKGLSSGDEK